MVNALLRLVPVLAALTFFFCVPARAQDVSVQAHGLIQSQLDAFERGDAGGAYALASPVIKSMFADSGVFMDMVRTRYAPVYHHRSAEFGAFSLDGDNASQSLTIIDDNNDVWTALYKLERQPDGSWLINGCVLIKSQDKSA